MKKQTKAQQKREFKKLLSKYLEEAAQELIQKVKDENLYSFAIHGVTGFYYIKYICFSANTEEGFEKTLADYMQKEPKLYSEKIARNNLRWKAEEWKYHDFYEPVKDLDFWKYHNKLANDFDDIFIDCLKHLAESELFQDTDITFMISYDNKPEESLAESLAEDIAKINNDYVAIDYLGRYTSVGYFCMIDEWDNLKKINHLLELFVDFILDRKTKVRTEAEEDNVTLKQVKKYLEEIKDERLITKLLDICEENGFSEKIFYEEDSPEYAQYGEITLEMELAISAVELMGECNLLENKVRLYELFKRRIKIDNGLEKTTYLATVMANMLRRIFGDFFPFTKTKETKHLLNYEDFISPEKESEIQRRISEKAQRESYFKALEKYSEAEKIDYLLKIYSDYYLDRDSKEKAEAEAQNVDRLAIWDYFFDDNVDNDLLAQGFLDLIEKYGLSPKYTNTKEERFAQNIADNLLRKGKKIGNETFARALEVLKKRVEIDKNLEETYGLAGTLATLLHWNLPDIFPKEGETALKTEHLVNYQDFINKEIISGEKDAKQDEKILELKPSLGNLNNNKAEPKQKPQLSGNLSNLGKDKLKRLIELLERRLAENDSDISNKAEIKEIINDIAPSLETEVWIEEFELMKLRFEELEFKFTEKEAKLLNKILSL